MHSPNKEFGFTLIELVVVIGVAGTLAAMSVPNIIDFTDEARYQAAKAQLINCSRGCNLSPSDTPRLDGLPGVEMSGASDCTDTAFARIGTNCCLSLNLASGVKNDGAGWATNFSGCTRCNVCASDPNISTKGYIIDMSKFTKKYGNTTTYGGIDNGGPGGSTRDWNHKWCSCERPCDQSGQYKSFARFGSYSVVNPDVKSFCEEAGYGKGVLC